MSVEFPLHWPVGLPRNENQISSRFTTGLNAAVNNVHDELRLLGKDTGKPVSDVLISSNATLGNLKPRDTGVAVYFRWDNIDSCIAVDRYKLIEDNLQAISKVVEAERAKLRHGGLNVLRASFRGYAALPPPRDASGQLRAPWRQILGLSNDKPLTLQEAESAYRALCKTHHPDRGGDAAKFNAITDAIREAREEFGQKS